MESRIGRSSARARARASSPQGYQSTGLSACWRRYGLVSSARRFNVARARLVLDPGRVDVLRRDDHVDARLVRAPPRVLVLAEVLLRQPVDLRVGTLLGELGASADRDPAVGVLWIDDDHGHPGIPLEMTWLGPS